MRSTENVIEQSQNDSLWRSKNYLLRSLMQKKLADMRFGHVVIIDSWGEWQVGQGHTLSASITVHDPAFYSYVFFKGSNGAADGYRKGLWSCSNLEVLFRILIANSEQMDAMEKGLAKFGVVKDRLAHVFRSNTRKGSQKNIHDHYDLGNDLFALFLDKTMTYSSGIFESKSSTLYDASRAKLDLICQKLGLKPEHHVIEIGTGWGSFSIHAVQHYGCHVTTTTISQEQYDLAKQRIIDAGLEDRIDLLLMDYRDLDGKYDRCVSIEMIEAVGHDFLPEYFNKCASLLKDDGQMCIQAITMPDHRYDDYLKRPDFIQRFIFPGSCVPSLAAMTQAISRSDLKVVHIEDYAEHYARTLRLWLENFRACADAVYALGYSHSFYRLWEYYLEYCAAGFTERYLGLLHIVLNKPTCRSELTNTKFIFNK